MRANTGQGHSVVHLNRERNGRGEGEAEPSGPADAPPWQTLPGRLAESRAKQACPAVLEGGVVADSQRGAIAGRAGCSLPPARWRLTLGCDLH